MIYNFIKLRIKDIKKFLPNNIKTIKYIKSKKFLELVTLKIKEIESISAIESKIKFLGKIFLAIGNNFYILLLLYNFIL
jgi:hypothetical protein